MIFPFFFRKENDNVEELLFSQNLRVLWVRGRTGQYTYGIIFFPFFCFVFLCLLFLGMHEDTNVTVLQHMSKEYLETKTSAIQPNLTLTFSQGTV